MRSRVEAHMEQREKQHVLTGGMILITLGLLIFLHGTTPYTFGMTWPVLLLVVAAGTLLQNPRDLGGWIIGVVGVIFLLKETLQFNMTVLTVYALPVLLVLLGIRLIVKQRAKKEP
jgi:hypothetical protein